MTLDFIRVKFKVCCSFLLSKNMRRPDKIKERKINKKEGLKKQYFIYISFLQVLYYYSQLIKKCVAYCGWFCIILYNSEWCFYFWNPINLKFIRFASKLPYYKTSLLKYLKYKKDAMFVIIKITFGTILLRYTIVVGLELTIINFAKFKKFLGIGR